MANLKTFRKMSSAIKHAAGRPIIRIGYSLWVAGEIDDITQIEIVEPNGRIIGHVGVNHLTRLGNANHATAAK